MLLLFSVFFCLQRLVLFACPYIFLCFSVRGQMGSTSVLGSR